MNRLMVMEIPGLTRDMVERHAPALRALSKRGCSAGIVPILPAVTMPDTDPRQLEALRERVNELYALDVDLLSRCCPLKTPGSLGL